MAHQDDDENGIPDLSNKQLLKVLLDEIADVRREIREEMFELRKELKGDIAALSAEFKTLKSDFQTLRLEVHQNQITFMKNHEDLERRVGVLEVAA